MLKRIEAVCLLYFQRLFAHGIALALVSLFLMVLSFTLPFWMERNIAKNSELVLPEYSSTLPGQMLFSGEDRIEEERLYIKHDELKPGASQETLFENEPQIKAVFLQCHDYGDRDTNIVSLQRLKRLTSLTYLNISKCQFAGDFDELPELPLLETLYLPPQLSQNETILKQLKKYPRLQTLAFNPWSDKAPQEDQVEGVANILEEIPDLETVYVGTSGAFMYVELSPEQRSIELKGWRLLQKELSSCLVLPTTMPRELLPVYMMYYMFYGMLMASLFQSGFRHLCRREAHLTPGYTTPHLIVISVMSVCLLFLVTWLRYEEAYRLGPIIATFAFILVGCVVCHWIFSQHVLLMNTAPTVIGMIYILFMFTPEPLWEFHLGSYPTIEWIVWGTIFASMLSLPYVMPRAIEQVREKGWGDLDWSSTAQMTKVVKPAMQDRADFMFGSQTDQKVQAAIQQHVNLSNKQSRLNLWRSGNPVSGLFHVFTILFLLWFIVDQYFDLKSSVWQVMMVWIALLFILKLPIWIVRKKSIANDILFPISRNDFRKMITKSMWIDHLFNTVVVVLLIGWISSHAESETLHSTTGIAVAMFAALAISLMMSVITMALFVFQEYLERHRWQTIIALVTLALLIGLISWKVSTHHVPLGESFFFNRTVILSAGIVCLVIATLLYEFVRHKLNRKEWGLQ